MKRLEIKQMENVQGGFDCSVEERIAFIAGAGIGGAIFFGGIGAFLAAYAATGYTVMRCDNR